VTAVKLSTWFTSETSWPSGNPANLARIADSESRLPPLEDASSGTRVGSGVASGVDAVYLTTDPSLVEPDRLLPLLMTRDTIGGAADWSGTYLVNPWENGRLVDLDDHPRLGAYLESHSSAVRERHVAQISPQHWYRTIDRVEPGLLKRDKLVIPDLKAFIQPVLDRSQTYPHHGLYFITSDQWDLEVLGGVLLSDLAELFVATCCVKMRRDCFRFQVQKPRRIRVPEILVSAKTRSGSTASSTCYPRSGTSQRCCSTAVRSSARCTAGGLVVLNEIPDYAEKVQATIDSYWHVRRSQAERSREAGVVNTGLRAEVTGGKHLNALQLLVVDVIVDAGIPAGKLQVKTRPVPGYFDNRTDEALRQAIDVSKAVERGIVDSPLRPWLGYVMLIEDNEAWNRTSKPRKPVSPADPVFDESSPADRAAIFFDRMVRERLLDAACVMLANRTTGGVTYKRGSLSLQSFAAALFGRCLQFRVTNSDIDWDE